MAYMLTRSPSVGGMQSRRSWPQRVEEAAELGGGENDPVSHPDRPS